MKYGRYESITACRFFVSGSGREPACITKSAQLMLLSDTFLGLITLLFIR